MQAATNLGAHARSLVLLLGLALACEATPSPSQASENAEESTLPEADETTGPAREDEDPFARENLAALAPLEVVAWPTENVHITSHFGWRVDPVSGQGTRLHRGLDLRGQIGDLVLSIADGRVRFVGHDPLLGKLVVIDHGQGVESFYGHLSDPLVHEGLVVQRGAAIGLVGNTGRSEAPHLHLSVRIGGVETDPLEIIGHPVHRLAAHTVRLAAPEAAPTSPGANE